MQRAVHADPTAHVGDAMVRAHPPRRLECRRGRSQERGRPALGESQNAADRRRSNAILALYSRVFGGC